MRWDSSTSTMRWIRIDAFLLMRKPTKLVYMGLVSSRFVSSLIIVVSSKNKRVDTNRAECLLTFVMCHPQEQEQNSTFNRFRRQKTSNHRSIRFQLCWQTCWIKVETHVEMDRERERETMWHHQCVAHFVTRQQRALTSLTYVKSKFKPSGVDGRSV